LAANAALASLIDTGTKVRWLAQHIAKQQFNYSEQPVDHNNSLFLPVCFRVRHLDQFGLDIKLLRKNKGGMYALITE
jgi:hypothetical protein